MENTEKQFDKEVKQVETTVYSIYGTMILIVVSIALIVVMSIKR